MTSYCETESHDRSPPLPNGDCIGVSKEFNQKVVNLGTEVFSSLGEVKLSTFNPRFWNGKLMEWSMTRPEFKVNLVRLVDVLPTLTSPKSVAEHVRQYLGPTLGDIHPSLEWAVGLTKNNILAAITSFFVHMGVRQMAGC